MEAALVKCAQYAVSFYAPDRRFRLAEEICGERPQHIPGDMLRAVEKRCGCGKLLLAELILFGWCAAACLLLDLLPPARPLIRNLLGFLCCLATFGLCGDKREHIFLKTGFLCFALLRGGSWTLTAGILLLYVHLI